jgi:hypothetical protein
MSERDLLVLAAVLLASALIVAAFVALVIWLLVR